MPGLPVNAPTDALLTIAQPPWRSICRSSCFMQLLTPRRLTPMTRSQSSRVLSAVGAIRAMTPALLNAASSRSDSATARSTIAATWVSLLETPGVPPDPLPVFREGRVRPLRERPLGFQDAEVFLEFLPRLWRGERHGD